MATTSNSPAKWISVIISMVTTILVLGAFLFGMVGAWQLNAQATTLNTATIKSLVETTQQHTSTLQVLSQATAARMMDEDKQLTRIMDELLYLRGRVDQIQQDMQKSMAKAE